MYVYTYICTVIFDFLLLSYFLFEYKYYANKSPYSITLNYQTKRNVNVKRGIHKRNTYRELTTRKNGRYKKKKFNSTKNRGSMENITTINTPYKQLPSQ